MIFRGSLKSTYPAWRAKRGPEDFHNGVIGVYADLFTKDALHPSRVLVNNKPLLDSRNKFDRNGKPNAKGSFDGVIAAAQPWTWRDKDNKQEVIFKAPKAIGWANAYKDPVIYGSNAVDVMFFDQFKDGGGSSWLAGLGGDDWLVGGKTDGKGIDRLSGGVGSDQFWFGYQRYGKSHMPYLDNKDETGFGGTAFAVVTDFNRQQDYLKFIWSDAEIARVIGSKINAALANSYGEGVGFLSNNDLIAYVPGLTLSQTDALITSSRISFNQTAQLDNFLLA